MDETTENALFDRSRAAVRFALNHTRSIYAQPLMTKVANSLAAAEEGSAKSRKAARDELQGMDGAAQAGLIYLQLQKLTEPQKDTLIARVAQHSFPCTCRSACCMGARPNPEWVEAIKRLSEFVRHQMDHKQAKARKKITIAPQLRRMLIEKHYGRKYVLADLSEQFQLSENTLTSYRKPITEILMGVEKDGWTHLDGYLTGCGIVGAIV